MSELKPIDNYFLQHEEPVQGCLQFLRKHILKMDPAIAEAWKYRMPFFCYNRKCSATCRRIKNTTSLTLGL